MSVAVVSTPHLLALTLSTLSSVAHAQAPAERKLRKLFGLNELRFDTSNEKLRAAWRLASLGARHETRANYLNRPVHVGTGIARHLDGLKPERSASRMSQPPQE